MVNQFFKKGMTFTLRKIGTNETNESLNPRRNSIQIVANQNTRFLERKVYSIGKYLKNLDCKCNFT